MIIQWNKLMNLESKSSDMFNLDVVVVVVEEKVTESFKSN